MTTWPRMGEWIEKISKSNALYPLLVAEVFFVVLAGTVITLVGNLLIQILVLLPVLGIAWQIIRSFEYFSKHNPNMLRTETYVIRSKVLDIFGDEAGTIQPTAADFVAISNPKNDSDKIDGHE